MKEDMDNGLIHTVVVKDLSRFGRDHITVGYYTEIYFSDMDIRFIAINDNVDTENSDSNEFAPFTNIFNEWYAKNTSKKVQAVFRAKGESGKRLGSVIPYGYIKNPDNPDLLAIDEEAAKVVRYIFELCMSGKGPAKIAKQLTAEGIPTPTVYFQQQNMSVRCKRDVTNTWCYRTVAGILENMTYVGCTVNFKTAIKNYKTHKVVRKPKEEWLVFENTHPAIIEKSVFDKVQVLRNNKRRYTKSGNTSIFSGVIKCADCGAKLYYHNAIGFKENQAHFICSNYKGNTGNCTVHYIREDVVYDIVLSQVQLMLDYLHRFEDDFVKSLIAKSETDRQKEFTAKKRKLEVNRKRIAELDTIFKRIYEDNICGKLTDERFIKLSNDYEAEQRNLQAENIILETELAESEEQANGIEYFLNIVRQYTEIKELDARVVNDLIDKIEVHAVEKVNGQRFQQIDIYYTAVGVIDIPQHIQELAV